MRKNGGWNKYCTPIEKAARFDSLEIKPEMPNGDIECERSGYFFCYSIFLDSDGDSVEIFYPGKQWKQEIRLHLHQCATQYYLFCCPECGRHVRYLYLGKNKRRFLCRKCSCLNYKSQQCCKNTTYYYDLGEQCAQEKFGFSFEENNVVPMDFPYITPGRPRGMHQTTYRKLLRHYEAYQHGYQTAFLEEALRILRKHVHY